MKPVPNPGRRLAAIVLLALITAGAANGQYVYRDRGDYFEGIRNERPISGVDVQLLSLCAIPDPGSPTESEEVKGYLHLAFVLPEEFESVDITIGGPDYYHLDRVEGDFGPGFNVFRWKSKVVKGLGLEIEDLVPRVAIVGGTYVPCFLDANRPRQMPDLEAYRVVLQSNMKGNMRYFVRDGDDLLVEEEVPVSANLPLEIHVPASSQAHHLDLHTILSYETQGDSRTVRQCFPIQVGRGEGSQVEGH